MRSLVAVLFTLLSASVGATICFDSPRVTRNGSACIVSITGCDSAVVSLALSLPVRTVYVPLREDQTARDLRGYWPKPMIVEQLGTDIVDDRTTTLEPRQSVPDLVRWHRPGRAPIEADELEIDGRRFARLVLFPVTVDSLGTLFFRSEFRLSLGQEPLDSTDLMPGVSFEIANGRNRSRSQATSGPPRYVVVTSTDLIPEATRLAAYKTSTGIPTTVVDIAELLPRYSGRDNPERLREYLKSFYNDGGEYVLLAGDETILPIRYTYALSTSIQPPVTDQQICDLYFADLTGEWDADSDGVWGEPYFDRADCMPELRVGRLPFNEPLQLSSYINKLIAYETLEGVDRRYINRAFFFSSDEMRDYHGYGQHKIIADAYPLGFDIDTLNGVETPTGGNPAPTNRTAQDVIDILSTGYGMVNILAHGRPDAFAVRTASYNERPNSYMIVEEPVGTNSRLDSLAPNNRVGFYYSIACDNGGFDEDAPPFGYLNPNLVTSALAQPQSGAVAFVAFSRWGWVGTSHELQKTFYDSLFAHPERPAFDAMALSKLRFPYYRDLAYGQNFYGDPSLLLYTDIPGRLDISFSPERTGPIVTVSDVYGPVPGAMVIVSIDSGRVATAETDAAGNAFITYDFAYGRTYTIAAVRPGYSISRMTFAPSQTTDTDERDNSGLPDQFTLRQNFPNPFNPSSVIAFDLPQSALVSLQIFDISGRRVTVLADDVMPAGRHEVTWDGLDSDSSPVASGIYLYRLKAGDFTASRKMVLLR